MSGHACLLLPTCLSIIIAIFPLWSLFVFICFLLVTTFWFKVRAISSHPMCDILLHIFALSHYIPPLSYSAAPILASPSSNGRPYAPLSPSRIADQTPIHNVPVAAPPVPLSLCLPCPPTRHRAVCLCGSKWQFTATGATFVHHSSALWSNRCSIPVCVCLVFLLFVDVFGVFGVHSIECLAIGSALGLISTITVLAGV